MSRADHNRNGGSRSRCIGPADGPACRSAFDPRVLRQAPFRLDKRACEWVCRTFAGMSIEAKLGQIVVPVLFDRTPVNLDRLIELKVGGLLRYPVLPLDALRADAEYVQARSTVPLLMCGDLEFMEGFAIGEAQGTAFPNQMAAAASGDPRFAAHMARIAAREGGAAGFNWSLTPVFDLSLEPRSRVVNTRSFGDDAARVATLARTYVAAMQSEGMAACAKHFPGDGTDDRNQHFVTSTNRLSKAEWLSTYGRVLRALIRQGVLSIMSAHIAFPVLRNAGGRPASISPELNLALLRRELGFNGVIVSDATVMAGLTAHGRREEIVPQLVQHGCDILLFLDDVELDISILRAALSDGRLSPARLDEAVWRTLALKGAIGLHRRTRGGGVRPLVSAERLRQHGRLARRCAQLSVTLVKDETRLLPLSPSRHRRVMLIEEPERLNPLGTPLPRLRVGELLRQRGFSVEHYTTDSEVSRDYCDVLIYIVAIEGTFLGQSVALDWNRLHGGTLRSMERHWHAVPTIFISLGSPYHLREVPKCPTFINAYSPVPPMQEAVVQALVGEIPFRGVSPVRLGH